MLPLISQTIDQPINRPKKTRLFILACFTLLIGSYASHAFTLEDIPSYTLRYSVSIKGTNVGELEIKISKKGKNAIVHGETFPNALANLIGDGKVIETIEYKMVGNTLLLSRITESKGKNNAKIKSLKVDHKKKLIITESEEIELSSKDQIDAYTFPLLSILGLNDARKGKQEKLPSANSVSRYRFLPPTKETIQTAAGEFKTIKQRKIRDDKNKSISLWLSEQAPIMPIKIQIDRKGKRHATIELILRSE